jgi:RNA polymerase sigma factor FliA
MANLDKLWRRYKKQNDLQAREEIILAYAYLAKYVVDRMLVRPSAAIGYEDLVGHAAVGLIDAVEKFDLSREVKFETYAVVRIRGAVLDAIKSMDWLPRSMRSFEQELRRVFAELEARFGRPATDAEVAAELDMDVDELDNAIADVGQMALLSLEDMIAAGDEDTSVTALGGQTDSAQNPVLSLEVSERKKILAQAVDGLPEREKLVISMYYKEGLTLKEIAAVLGVTESRACQIHSKSVIRLQGKLARHAELLLAA